MKITHVSVEGVGRFAQAVTISSIAPGLNVLAAPNEAGKSTLFRAVRACMFEKHTAKSEAIRELASDGASLPVTVEMGFEHGGARYVVRKTFLSSPRASLIKDGREIAAGRAADEELHELLGLKPGSGKNVDTGAFGLLWVGQTQSFEPPTIEGAAKDSISSAIEREVGSLVGGDRARGALKSLDAELKPFLTSAGGVAKNGPLGQAESRLDELCERLTKEEALLAALERDIAGLESKRRERSQLTNPATEAELREQFNKASKILDSARAIAAEVREMEKDNALAQLAFETAQRAFTDLADCATRIDATQAALIEAHAALAPLERDEQACALRLASARQQQSAIELEETRLTQAEAHLRRLASAAHAASKKPELQRRLDLLEKIASEIAASKGARSRIVATAADVHEVDKIERDIALLHDRLNAAAPRIDVTPAPGAAAAFLVNGAMIEGRQSFPAMSATTIEIAGTGCVVVTPPPGFGESERESLRDLQAKHAKRLALAGADDLAGLQAFVERARALDSDLQGLRAQLAALNCEEEKLPAQTQILRKNVAEAIAAIADELGDEPAPDLATIEDKQKSLQESRARCAHERKRVQAIIDAAADNLRALTHERASKRAQADELTRNLAADTTRLPAAARTNLIADAGAALDDKRRAHEKVALSLKALRASAPDDQKLVDLETRAQRFKSAIDNHLQQIADIERDITRLEGAIRREGGEGLGERVQALGEERDLAQRDADRIKARVQALKLLREVIRQCYEEQREYLQKPIRRHLQPFLDDVFPNAELTLDESFQIERFSRAGANEAFKTLSGGTQEQIAVLVRLAMGALLQERGEDAPIILDDALVFCDDDRIEQMFDALTRAASRQQVIVLTCRTRGFRSLGGRMLTIEPVTQGLR
jgi:uncharacterized protein YhaN